MNERLTLVVSIWLRDGNVEAFESYERFVSYVMSKHGGRIERAVRIEHDPYAYGVDQPFEVHIVSFPDRASFDRYRNDPDLEEVETRRWMTIGRTEIMMGNDVEPY